MAAQAKVIIKAEENISSAVNSAKGSLNNLESMCSKVVTSRGRLFAFKATI